MDIRKIKYGKFNYQDGLKFYARKSDNIITLYISDICVNKRQYRKAIMEPDCNHERPHIHVANKKNPKNPHDGGASIAIDNGELLAGECDDYDDVKDWVDKHKTTLLEMWDGLKDGSFQKETTEEMKKKKIRKGKKDGKK